MESQQIFWIVVFGFLLIAHSVIYYVVVTYEKKLKKKKKGKGGGYLEYIKKMARKEKNKKEGFLEGLVAKEKGEEAASGAAGTLGPTKTAGKGGKSSGSEDKSGISTKSGDKKKGHIQTVAGKGGGRALNKKPLAKKKISPPSGTLGKVPTKNTCKKDPGMCKGKFIQAYKATGCDAVPTTAVFDWWREKKDDSDIWKNMLTRCQKSQKCLTCKTDTDKKAAIKECRISGIPAKTCKLQTGWPKTCTEVASAKKSGGAAAAGCPTIPIPSSIKAAETKPKKKKKKEKKPLVCPTESPEKPGDIPQPRKRGPQCPVKWQIPGHRHNVYDPERMKVLTEIKGLMGLLRKKMDLKGRPPYQTRLTPEQYKLWLKAIGALKVRKKIKKKPQPISVNVDVTDSRVLEYEVPSALISLPGTEVTGKNQLDRKRAAAKRLKKLLQSLNLNPETRDQVKKALDDYDGLGNDRSLPKGEREEGKKSKDKKGRGKGGSEGEGEKGGTRPGRSDEEDRRNEMRKHKSSQPAKFQDLLKAVQKNPYLAYNEDDYGDITNQIKGADKPKLP